MSSSRDYACVYCGSAIYKREICKCKSNVSNAPSDYCNNIASSGDYASFKYIALTSNYSTTYCNIPCDPKITSSGDCHHEYCQKNHKHKCPYHEY